MAFEAQDYNHILEILDKNILPGMKEFAPDNLVLGEPGHPKRLKRTVPVPYYINEHRNHFFEFCYIIDGKFVITLESHSYLMGPGDLCVVRPFMNHYESYYRAKDPFEVLWGVGGDIRRSGLVRCFYKPGEGQWVNDQAGARNVHREIALLHKIIELGTDKKKNREKIQRNLQRIFKGYQDGLKREKRFRARNLINFEKKFEEIEKMNEAHDFIRDHCTEKLLIQEMASRYSLSLDRFEKLYRKIHGSSVKENLLRFRIESALDMMEQTDLPLSEISFKTGFVDQYYFSRLFKKVAGCSPTAYRKRYIRP